MSTMVVDLSHHNVIPQSLGPLRAQGIKGIIHKATEGVSYEDPKLNARVFLAREARLHFGVYHFLRPGDMGEQVDHFIATAELAQEFDGQMASWLWACDYEDAAVSLAEVEDFCGDLMNTLKGQMPVLYSGHVLKDKIAAGESVGSLPEYRLWLAQYTGGTPTLPQGWDKYWLWQFTDQGQLAGIDGFVDLNDYQGNAQDLANEWSGAEAKPSLMVSIQVNAPPGIAIQVNGITIPNEE